MNQLQYKSPCGARVLSTNHRVDSLILTFSKILNLKLFLLGGQGHCCVSMCKQVNGKH